MKKSNVTQELEANIKARTPKTSPWYIKMAVWFLDTFSAIAILALAIRGAVELVQSSLAAEAKIGIAALIVGLLASRLLERVFQVRR